MKRFAFMVLAMTGLSACSLMQRSPGSGYSFRDDFGSSGLDYREERSSLERERAAGELGYSSSVSLNSQQAAALESRMALSSAERDLAGRKEREHYYRHKPLLRSDRERLEFLRLPSVEARERWLARRGISASNPQHPPAIQKLIEQNDITLGMSRQAVRESWGEPEMVEVAGNPIYGNERWKYLEEISSSEGYRTETRFIFFESGRVVGWDKQ